jgi:hypothetical protein
MYFQPTGPGQTLDFGMGRADEADSKARLRET